MKPRMAMPEMGEWTRLFIRAFGQAAGESSLGANLQVLAAVVGLTDGEPQAVVTTPEIVAATGLSGGGVRYALDRLTNAGMLLRDGRTKNRFYRVSPDFFFRGDSDAYPAACRKARERSRLKVVK